MNEFRADIIYVYTDMLHLWRFDLHPFQLVTSLLDNG